MWARPPRSIILSDHLATTIPLVRISICADTCFSFYLKPLNRFQHFNLITFRTVTCQNVCWLFTLFTLLVVFLSPQLLLLFRIKHKGIKVVLTCFLKFWQEGKYEHIYRTIFLTSHECKSSDSLIIFKSDPLNSQATPTVENILIHNKKCTKLYDRGVK